MQEEDDKIMTVFRDLQIWNRARVFAVDMYKLTASFPADERFNLISQIRRSALSVPTNIAEGCGYESDAQMYKFLGISYGSLNEVESLLIISSDLEFINAAQFEKHQAELIEMRRMLSSLMRKVETRI